MSNHLECPRAGKWIGGCRFEGRWEYGASRPASFAWGISVADQERLTHATKPKTYVRDVCVTCGRTVEKQETAA